MMALARRIASKSPPPPTLGDIVRCYVNYRRVYGRYPSLSRPQRFSEKIQWRKLFDLDPRYPIVSDKIASRQFIAARVGDEWLPELLWSGESPDDVPFDRLPPPYILKTNHASAQNVIVTDAAALDREAIRHKLRTWLAVPYGLLMREPAYSTIRPRLLVEKLLVNADGLPPFEHKMFVFDGKLRCVQTIIVDDNRKRYSIVHTRDWQPLSWRAVNPLYDKPLPRPAHFAKFVELAETIAAGFDHLRVDIYEWNGQPRVGELTLYNASGMTPFTPDEADVILGDWWTLRRPLRRAIAPTIFGLPSTWRRGLRRLRAGKPA